MAYPLQSCLLQRGVILHFGLSKDWWSGCYPVDAVSAPSSILKGGPLIFPLSWDELHGIQKMNNGYSGRYVGAFPRPSILASCSGSSACPYCDCSYSFNGDGLGQSPGFRGGIRFRSMAGFLVAQRNNALVFLHALAQLAFAAGPGPCLGKLFTRPARQSSIPRRPLSRPASCPAVCCGNVPGPGRRSRVRSRQRPEWSG